MTASKNTAPPPRSPPLVFACSSSLSCWLTSGASGRIIPLLRNFRRSVPSPARLIRVFFFLQSIVLWFLLFLRRRSPLSAKAAAASSPSSPRGRRVGRNRPMWRRLLAVAEEEEDVRRRRALAEKVKMICSSSQDGDEDEDEDDPDCQWERFVFIGPRRNMLFCRSWVPATRDMRSILVIIHGLNEHSGRYSRFAKQLTACNFGVYAMDWIGHGGSDGLHGYVPSLDYVVEDTGAFLEKIKYENPGIPCFLFGHSTGGAVVLKAASYPHIEAMIEGIVLTSPALRVKPAHPMVGAVAPIFSLVAPKFQFKGANRRGLPVSRDPAAIIAKYTDPLVYTGPIRVRTGHEILRISSYLMRNMKYVTIPFLVLHGTADRITDPLASEELYNVAASKYKDIKLYEGFLHDLLFEPEWDEIGKDIINWMQKRLLQENLLKD